MNKSRTSLLIVENQTLVRKGFRALLQMYRPGWKILEATDGIKALLISREERPDIILMNYKMPRLDGLKAATYLLKDLPGTKMIMLSGEQQPEFIARTFATGFLGYLTKDSSDTELMEAIDAVASGKIYIRPDLVQYANIDLISSQRKKIYRKHSRATELSLREAEILRYLSNGLKCNEVSRQLGISERTVSNHKANIYRKYQLHSIADMVRFAVQYDLIG